MTHPLRLPLALITIAAIAGGGYWMYGQLGSGEVIPTPIEAGGDRGAPDPTPDDLTDSAAGVSIADGGTTRIPADADNTHQSALQGIKGRVLLPDGTPAAGVPVFLMENMMNDPIGIFLMSRSGRSSPPVAAGTTSAEGTFALGARKVGKTYDLRVVSEFHPELTHQSVKVRSQDWYDTGDLVLDHGLTVLGRVIDERSKIGIPDARVYLTNSNAAHTLLAVPGRERGTVAVTDATGAFRFGNAPSKGNIDLAAEAPGYAATVLRNQPMRAGADHNFTLEIAEGAPIAGITVDPTGEPIANVKITAQGLSQKTPQSATATSDAKGMFVFPSLRNGPYQLVTSNSAHAETKTPPVMTGETEVKVVLIPRPWVKLRVRSARGQPLEAYHISLKRHFPNSELGIGNVPEFRDRTITPADYSEFGDWAVIRGLPAGKFVFQIKHRDHAKSLSPPFLVRPESDPAEVEATLTLGASIVGTVVDGSGKPVRNAVVSTDRNNAFGAEGLGRIFQGLIPERHTKMQTRTDAGGRFRLTSLALADYMLRVSHSDYCEGRAMDITLATEGQVFDAGAVQLSRGAVVEGFTTVAGLAAGQIKVAVTTPQKTTGAPHKDLRPATPLAVFSATAVSDTDGRFRLLKRVPPGTYKIQAMRAAGSSSPFDVLLDIRETEKTITIAQGQDRFKIDFNLSAR